MRKFIKSSITVLLIALTCSACGDTTVDVNIQETEYIKKLMQQAVKAGNAVDSSMFETLNNGELEGRFKTGNTKNGKSYSSITAGLLQDGRITEGDKKAYDTTGDSNLKGLVDFLKNPNNNSNKQDAVASNVVWSLSPSYLIKIYNVLQDIETISRFKEEIKTAREDLEEKGAEIGAEVIMYSCAKDHWTNEESLKRSWKQLKDLNGQRDMELATTFNDYEGLEYHDLITDEAGVTSNAISALGGLLSGDGDFGNYLNGHIQVPKTDASGGKEKLSFFYKLEDNERDIAYDEYSMFRCHGSTSNNERNDNGNAAKKDFNEDGSDDNYKLNFKLTMEGGIEEVQFQEDSIPSNDVGASSAGEYFTNYYIPKKVMENAPMGDVLRAATARRVLCRAIIPYYIKTENKATNKAEYTMNAVVVSKMSPRAVIAKQLNQSNNLKYVFENIPGQGNKRLVSPFATRQSIESQIDSQSRFISESNLEKTDSIKNIVGLFTITGNITDKNGYNSLINSRVYNFYYRKDGDVSLLKTYLEEYQKKALTGTGHKEIGDRIYGLCEPSEEMLGGGDNMFKSSSPNSNLTNEMKLKNIVKSLCNKKMIDVNNGVGYDFVYNFFNIPLFAIRFYEIREDARQTMNTAADDMKNKGYKEIETKDQIGGKTFLLKTWYDIDIIDRMDSTGFTSTPYYEISGNNGYGLLYDVENNLYYLKKPSGQISSAGYSGISINDENADKLNADERQAIFEANESKDIPYDRETAGLGSILLPSRTGHFTLAEYRVLYKWDNYTDPNKWIPIGRRLFMNRSNINMSNASSGIYKWKNSDDYVAMLSDPKTNTWIQKGYGLKLKDLCDSNGNFLEPGGNGTNNRRNMGIVGDLTGTFYDTQDGSSYRVYPIN